MPRLVPPDTTVPLELDGEALEAVPGEPIAAALLAAGETIFSRSVKYHRPRGPYCMAGRCSHCVMRVDGEPNVYTCLAPVTAGCKVERQNSFPSASLDLFGAIDWLYPRGLDHHSLFAGVPVVEAAVSKVARHLAGLGTLPDAAGAPEASCLAHETDVLVVGAGPAGLSAALAAAKAGARVTLLDDQPVPGGRLRGGLALPGDPAPSWVDEQVAAVAAAGGRLLSGAFALGAFRDEHGPVVAARAAGRRLLLVRHRALVAANGAGEALPAFESNELPGVFGARALARLVAVHGVLPGASAAIAGTGPDAVALADLLASRGCEVVALVGPKAEVGRHRLVEGTVARARGKAHVAGVAIAKAGGGETKLRCELIAVAGAAAPLFDLARQAGAFVRFDATTGFSVEADEDGRTLSPDVLACGEVRGPATFAEAVAQGARAGAAAARGVVR